MMMVLESGVASKTSSRIPQIVVQLLKSTVVIQDDVDLIDILVGELTTLIFRFSHASMTYCNLLVG